MFSVIIPTRDRPQFLARAVASVRAQTLACELIVVNDGTEPVTTDALIIDNREAGHVQARVRGVETANQKYVAFLDDDDVWLDARHLERAAAALGNGALCFSDGLMLFDDGTPPLSFARNADARSLEADNTILVSGLAYHRSLHAELGGFDTSLRHYWDWDWYLRVARAGHELVHIRHQSVAITVHSGNMSGPEGEAERANDLARFATKHGLGPIPLKNHVTIAREGRDSF